MSTTDPATPLAIIGIGCLFPGADGLSAYWARIQERRRCHHRRAAHALAARGLLPPRPQGPRPHLHGSAAASCDADRLQSRRLRHRPQQPRSHRHLPAARPGGGPAGSRRRRLWRGVAPSIAAASPSSSASPARWSWSSRWGRGSAIRSGAAPARGRRRRRRRRGCGAAHRRFLCRLAGELLSRPARQRGRRPHRQPLRPGRHQLRRRCRLRLVARARCTWPAWN